MPDTLKSPKVLPKVGISACLLGEQVRYDGGHKRSQVCCQFLSPFLDFQPICPEVGMGMPVPRPPIQLRKTASGIALVDVNQPRKEHDTKLKIFFQDSMPALQELDGYIWMDKSPSCGLKGVPVFESNGQDSQTRAQGAFARSVSQAFPQMVMLAASDLNNESLRNHFLIQVMVKQDWRQLIENKNQSVASLIQYHSEMKFLLLAYNESIYRKMGPLLANAQKASWSSLCDQYQQLLGACFESPCEVGGHKNVLLHMLGFIKSSQNKAEKAQVLHVISALKDGKNKGLLGVVLLLKEMAEKEGCKYVLNQKYISIYSDVLSHQFKTLASA